MSISFQSKIKLVRNNDFEQATRKIDKSYFIDYPWGLKNSVIGKEAYTTDVFDCTVCGIKDGQKVLMLHISPYSNDGQDFSKIENFITQHIDLKKPNISGFLIGSKMGFDVFERSEKLFDKFKNFMITNKIPYSELRGGIGGKNVGYNINNDELFIGTDLFERDMVDTNSTPIEVFARQAFQEVKLSDEDKLFW